MPNTPRQRPRRKKKNRSALYAPLAFIVICAALIFGMSVFFRVSRIEVVGNSYYTEQEILDAAGIEKGDNLFFINRATVNSRIYSKLPYVSLSYVSRSLPNRVTIEITESSAVAWVETDSGPWLIDWNCKLLTQSDPQEALQYIRVDGISAVAPAVGDTIEAGAENKAKISYLSEILDQIQRRGMAAEVTYVDVSAEVDPFFDYQGRFTVKLGAQDNTEYKFGMLLSAVSKLSPGDTGTMDLSLSADNKAHFSPA